MAHNSSSGALQPSWLGRWFTEARRAGLLALLDPEQWHTLCAILSFTTREGGRPFTLDHLGVALGLPPAEAERRLAHLSSARWRDETLVHVEWDQTGAVSGARVADLEVLAAVGTTSEGLEPTASPEGRDAKLAARLEGVGLTSAQIATLLTRYPAESIRRQIEWLPARKAKNPAALLIRAVERDWSAPKEAL